MTEAIVSAALASVAGVTAIVNRLHNRINSVHSRITEMDRRVDTMELRIAQNYVQKAEFSKAMEKMEDHMVRMEAKLDQIIMRDAH